MSRACTRATRIGIRQSASKQRRPACRSHECGAPESKSDSLERFPGSGVTPPTSRGLNRFHGQKNGLGGEAYLGCSLFKRRSSRLTLDPCHLPPRAEGTFLRLSSRAMASNEMTPFAWSARMVGANFLARVSATCLPSCPLLILPPLPGVSRPRRFNILTTVVVCHLPPWAVGIPLRFNSCASAGREMMPAALSSRMIWTKARARESAARLLANPPCTPRWRRDVSACCRSIGPSWLVLDVRLGGKNVAGVVGSFKKLTTASRKFVPRRQPALRSAREPATIVAVQPLPVGPFFISLV
jgi:hypothetical protein